MNPFEFGFFTELEKIAAGKIVKIDTTVNKAGAPVRSGPPTGGPKFVRPGDTVLLSPEERLRRMRELTEGGSGGLFGKPARDPNKPITPEDLGYGV